MENRRGTKHAQYDLFFEKLKKERKIMVGVKNKGSVTELETKLFFIWPKQILRVVSVILYYWTTMMYISHMNRPVLGAIHGNRQLRFIELGDGTK